MDCGLHHAARTIRGIERCICAQLCRGESGSHVQVAGASLAGNDHSLSSSTLIGCVSGLFGRGRAGTGSSLCGSVGDRSSMDETIHRSCRASHRERDRWLWLRSRPESDSSTGRTRGSRRVPGWSHAARNGRRTVAVGRACGVAARSRTKDWLDSRQHSSCQREQCAWAIDPCSDDQHRERCRKFRARRIAMGPRSDDMGPRHHVRTVG